MIQRFRIELTLICTIIIIFVFCITENKAGVVLRNFKTRRMIMEELEAEEKALKARLSLNLTNLTESSNANIKTANLFDKRNLNNSLGKTANIDGLAIGLRNTSKSQTKNSKSTSENKIITFKSQNTMVIPQTTNKTTSQKPNILTRSSVEYIENRGKRMEEEVSSRKPNIHSFVEYLENRGKKMTNFASENDKDETPIWISKNKINESAPFRLISNFNESIVVLNEMRENSSLQKDGKKSEAEPKEIFTALHELGNHTLKNSELDGKQDSEDGQHINMNNFTDIVKEIFDANISELPENSFMGISLKPLEKENNDSKIPEQFESNDFENSVSANLVKKSELKIPFADIISDVHTKEQSKNFTVHTTIKDTKKSLEEERLVNQIKETKDNEFSIEKILNETEEQFELHESSDIIIQATKEIAEILPVSNETISKENIEEFVVNLTDNVQSMSDEDIINLEPEDEQISQLVQNQDSVGKSNVSAAFLNDTQNDFEVNLESVVSSGLDFIVNSEVAKNAAMAMEVFNLSDSSLTDHVIEDSDMHSFIDIMMPSVSLNEIGSIPKDGVLTETITSNSSVKLIEVNSTNDTNSKFNASLVEGAILESDSNATATECPSPGICVFWFMARDSCSDHSQCLGKKMCCRVRCSKSCIDI